MRSFGVQDCSWRDRSSRDLSRDRSMACTRSFAPVRVWCSLAGSRRPRSRPSRTETTRRRLNNPAELLSHRLVPLRPAATRSCDRVRVGPSRDARRLRAFSVRAGFRRRVGGTILGPCSMALRRLGSEDLNRPRGHRRVPTPDGISTSAFTDRPGPSAGGRVHRPRFGSTGSPK